METDIDIFKNSKFKFPFNSPLGVVWEIYSIKEMGSWGCITINKDNSIDKTEQNKGTMYSVTAEIECLKNEKENEWMDFCVDPIEYLRQNPHLETVRKIENVWLTDEDLIENEE